MNDQEIQHLLSQAPQRLHEIEFSDDPKVKQTVKWLRRLCALLQPGIAVGSGAPATGKPDRGGIPH